MSSRPLVNEADRAAARRQAAMLDEMSSADELDATAERALVTWADSERAKVGDDPLAAWWSAKPELELHRRARALGLLG